MLLAVLLIVFGVAIAALDRKTSRMSDVSWHEWRHAVAIFAVCAFAAWASSASGTGSRWRA